MSTKAVARQDDAISVTVRVKDNRCEIAFGSRVIFLQSDVLRGCEFRNFDFALLAVLTASVSSGDRFRFDYPVTRAALDQFQRYTRLLRIMAPEEFRAPQVVCSKVVESDAADSGNSAICLSGGVDSVFAAVFHPGEWTHSVLIKGADYKLEDTHGFDDLKRRVVGISSELGFQTTIFETNLKEFMASYKLQHAAMLACCLHCLGAIGFARGAFASDYPRWQELVAFPWGNLGGLADALTTAAFPISHAGEGPGRSEKIRRIAAANPGLFSHISVCWSDRTSGGNCGQCSKCMRTRLNLYAIADEGLRREIELSLFGNHADPVQYLKNYQIDGKLKLIRREIGWFDDIMLSLPDGELRDAAGVLLNRLMDACLHTEPRRPALIPRLISRISGR